MKLDYIINYNGRLINTCTNKEIDPLQKGLEISKIERKYNVKIFKDIIKDNLFYKYDVELYGQTLKLIVYKGSYSNQINWSPVYNASIISNQLGIIEDGELDLEFWHEYFATSYGLYDYDEFNVSLFSLNENPMKIVRKLFPTHLEDNVFMFFEKYKTLKKINEKRINANIFNDIPLIKLNKNVGKALDSTKNQYYALQKEVIINNEVFFDITLIVGPVKNGVMDIQEKHRYFITEDYAYSPTDSDLRLLIDNRIYGNIYDKLMKRKYPSLMLDKYDGKYYYSYLLSKNFLPAFEILAKAGLSKLADLCLDNYHFKFDNFYKKDYKTTFGINKFNLYGKNDKEIFGFKLKFLKNLNPNCYMPKNESYNESFTNIINDVSRVVNTNPNILNQAYDRDIYEYILARYNSKTIKKELKYLKTIGSHNQSLYLDYLRLCNQTKKYSGGLCPTNLRHEHDVMTSYIGQLKEAKNNKIFEEKVSSYEYQELLYENDKYCILAPRKADDLVNESYQLSHCVRGYISSVSSGYTKIYFMRTIDKKAKSLVTLEVKNGCVKQARGKANRHLTQEEENFVSEWMNNKCLIDDYHPYRF